jgi:very-short-patch-repair endonuclease
MVKFKGRKDYPFYYGAKPEILGYAYDLRNSMTPAECLLWQRLRRKQLSGYRFRRQHPVNEFIVDFFCPDAQMVIEIDGEVHDDPSQKERDLERTRILNRFGLKVLRFSNAEVIGDIDSVLEKIANALN